MTEACKKTLWLKNFLSDLGHKQEIYVVNGDNQSAIHLAKNHTFHSRSKHIDVRYHWIREVLDDGLLQLEKVHTDDNWSDMLTKTVSVNKLSECCKGVGLMMPLN